MTVVTYDGKTADKDTCRYIKGDYYIIGDPGIKDSGQCYAVTGKNTGETKFYRVNSGYIVFHESLQEYVLTSDYPKLVSGVINDLGEMGYFEIDPFNTEYVIINKDYDMGSRQTFRSDDVFPIINTTVAKSLNNSFYDPTMGRYLMYCTGNDKEDQENLKRNLKSSKFLESFRGKKNRTFLFQPYEGFDNPYNVEQSNLFKDMQIHHKDYASKLPQFEISHIMNKLFGKYTFGIEQETSGGNPAKKELFRHGFLPIRDGSIGGHEFVSVPFKGEAGFNSAISFSTKLLESCSINEFTSVHYHIGSFLEKLSKEEFAETILAIYMLYYNLQQEIFEMIPPYKRSQDYFKNKPESKDHCQLLRSLGLFSTNFFTDEELDPNKVLEGFLKIKTFANNGVPVSKTKAFSRQYVEEDTSKWNIHSRYYALNLFNALFKKSHTVEFRAFSGSVNPEKIILQLAICLFIIEFARMKSTDIIRHREKYNLEDIVAYVLENANLEDQETRFITTLVLKFISERKEFFLDAFNNKDIYAKEFSRDYTDEYSAVIFHIDPKTGKKVTSRISTLDKKR